MKTIFYVWGCLVALMLTACDENERLPFSGEPSVYFNEQITVNGQPFEIFERGYSFAGQSSSVIQDTVWLASKVIGYTADTDRHFKAVVVGDSSAAQVRNDTVYYEVLDGVIPAGEVNGYLPLVIYRTAWIQDTTLQVTLKIVDAEGYDLQAGTPGNLSFTVYWSDRLVKPANWDASLSFFFGAYSTTKYQFIIDVLGVAEFTIYSRFNPTGAYTTGDMYDFRSRLKEALQAYNDTHDPDMTDETGALVTFP